MSILRKQRKVGWTTIDNSILEDESISWRAKGLACYLISKPDDWVIRMPYLVLVGKEGEKAVRTALHELATAGYLMRHREQDALGQLRTITVIADHPAFIDTGTVEERINGYSKTDIPISDRSETGRSLINTDIPNTDHYDDDDDDTAKPPVQAAKPKTDDRDGRMLIALIQRAGFFYLGSQPTRAVMQLESDYTDDQLRAGLAKMQEAHQKQINTGKRGITDPLAYLGRVLLGMDTAQSEDDALLERQRAAGVALPHLGIVEPWWKAKGRAYKLCPEFEPKVHGELYAALQKATGREALIATSGELSDKAAGEVQRATVALYGMGYETVEQLRELYRAYKQKHPKTTLPRPEWLTDFGSRLKTEQENKHGQNGNGHGGGTGEVGGGFASGNGGSSTPALDPAIQARFQRRREQRAAERQ